MFILQPPPAEIDHGNPILDFNWKQVTTAQALATKNLYSMYYMSSYTEKDVTALKIMLNCQH